MLTYCRFEILRMLNKYNKIWTKFNTQTVAVVDILNIKICTVYKCSAQGCGSGDICCVLLDHSDHYWVW